MGNNSGVQTAFIAIAILIVIVLAMLKIKNRIKAKMALVPASQNQTVVKTWVDWMGIIGVVLFCGPPTILLSTLLSDGGDTAQNLALATFLAAPWLMSCGLILILSFAILKKIRKSS
jgi:hypothetical protein